MRRTIFVFALLFLASVADAADDSLVALSLKAAEGVVKRGTAGGPDAERLGGITRLMGVMFDRERHDIVLIGRVEEDRPALHLSDFVTALRAIINLREWPLVSIDPAPDSRTSGKQRVRFEGGIAGSSFGKAALDADVALKGLGIGTLQVKGLPSFFEVRAAAAKVKADESQGSNQVWFCALEPILEQREDVFAIRDLTIGVRTKPAGNAEATVHALSSDAAADVFARNLTNAFEMLAQAIPEIRPVRGLFEMVALADGIRSLSDADVSYWLNDYPVPEVATPTEFDYVVRRELIPTADGIRALEIGGGINLRVLAIRIEDGDITALRDAVLISRPELDVLTWKVPLSEWAIGGSAPTTGLAGIAKDHDAGTPLDWHLLDDKPLPGMETSRAKLQTNQADAKPEQVSKPFRLVDPREFTIVSPRTDGPVITLPDERTSLPKPATSRTKPSADLKSLIADLKEGVTNRSVQLSELPDPSAPKPMYRLGADGLHYLSSNSLDGYLPDPRDYFPSAFSAEKGGKPSPESVSPEASRGMYRVGADGLNYLNENPLERRPPSPGSSPSTGSGIMCITAGCLGQEQRTRDGLRATPYAYGDLNPYSPRRYYEAGWTVSSGGKVLGSGFGDVKLLDGQKFAAKDWNGDGYRIHDATSKPVSSAVFRDVESLGNGYFAVPSDRGIGMMTIMNPELKSVRDVPAYDLPRYASGGELQNDVATDMARRVGRPEPASIRPAESADRGGIKADVAIDDADFGPVKKKQNK